MQYRSFTKDNLQVSLLGFGCMRFPILNDDPGEIDEIQSMEMIRHAIDNGVNYIDTAYNYHQGNSEIFVGKALKDGYREKVYLATKLPVWLAESYADFEKLLDEQLEKLDTEYIDFYLLHALRKETWNNAKALDVLGFLDKAKEKGKIKYAGFSFHDELPIFKEIIDSYPWDFCQIQLNYMDTEYQAGVKGLEYAKAKDISVVVMEPIKGGKLAEASDEIKEIWSRSDIERSPAEWALRWVYDFEEVSVVLSGMSHMDHVKENIASTENSLPKSLSEEEHRLIDKVTSIYKEKVQVGCTTCNYCMPCPEGVAIPNVFTLFNNMYVYDTVDESKSAYEKLINDNKDASICIECGICEQLCPQNLEIIASLKDARQALSK